MQNTSDTQNIQQIPPGTYRAKVVAHEIGTAVTTGTQFLLLFVLLLDGAAAGEQIEHKLYVTPKAWPRAVDFLIAYGFASVDDYDLESIEDIVNSGELLPGIGQEAVVRIRDEDNGRGGEEPRIFWVTRPRSGTDKRSEAAEAIRRFREARKATASVSGKESAGGGDNQGAGE